MAGLSEFSLCGPSVLSTLTCTSAASAPAHSGVVVSGGSLAKRETVESAVTLKSLDSGAGCSERCCIELTVSDVAHERLPAVQTSPVASADQTGKKNRCCSELQEYFDKFITTVEPVCETVRRHDKGKE